MAISAEQLKVGKAFRLSGNIYEIAAENLKTPLGRSGDEVFIRSVDNDLDKERWPVHVSHHGVHHESFAVALTELELA